MANINPSAPENKVAIMTENRKIGFEVKNRSSPKIIEGIDAVTKIQHIKKVAANLAQTSSKGDAGNVLSHSKIPFSFSSKLLRYGNTTLIKIALSSGSPNNNRDFFAGSTQIVTGQIKNKIARQKIRGTLTRSSAQKMAWAGGDDLIVRIETIS
jgi:hypothetical protein